MNWKIIRLIDEYVGIPLMYSWLCMRWLCPRAVRRDAALQRCRRILLVKFWGIGNLFLMLPAVSALRKDFPDAELDMLTLETNRNAAQSFDFFTNIHTVDTRSIARFILSSIRTMAFLRRRDYDIIIDFEQFARFSALVTAWIGRKRTVGFNTASQHRHYLFSRALLYDNRIHIARSYCTLVQAAGTDVGGDCSPDDLSGLALPDRPKTGILERLGIGSDRMVVMFHVGTSANFSERRWPTSHYAALADLLIERHGARIVLSGLPEERFLAAEVLEQSHCREGIVDASGQLGFAEYYDLIRGSDLVVSADTAAVHIASALRIPVVGLYGPNTPLLYGPWGDKGLAFYEPPPCSPCITNFNAKTHDCRHSEGKGACMRKISPDEVYRGIRERYLEGAGDAMYRRTAETRPCDR